MLSANPYPARCYVMLNQRWTRIRDEILDLYRQLDEDVEAFAGRSGLQCPSGCGACCQTPHVEATVAEMLPLAQFLFAEDRVEDILDRLPKAGSVCVQYEPRPGFPDQGRCRTYAQRPVICRMFGYAGTRDKAGQMRFGACAVLRKVETERVGEVEKALKQGTMTIPFFGPAHERVSEIGGTLGQDLLPINEALQRAIQILGLQLQLEDQPAEL